MAAQATPTLPPIPILTDQAQVLVDPAAALVVVLVPLQVLGLALQVGRKNCNLVAGDLQAPQAAAPVAQELHSKVAVAAVVLPMHLAARAAQVALHQVAAVVEHLATVTDLVLVALVATATAVSTLGNL